MLYNPFYYLLFRGTMKKVLTEEYHQYYAEAIMKKSDRLYPKLVKEADDIGRGNPMAYNEWFALAFVAPYLASGKQIPPQTIQEMMRRSLYQVKWYFARSDFNKAKEKKRMLKKMQKYVNWYTPEREKRYPNSFRVDFVGSPHEEACYYRITRCPICTYLEKLNCQEVMPLLCELDDVMIALMHGVLYREQTIASGGQYCDYYIIGNKERKIHP